MEPRERDYDGSYLARLLGKLTSLGLGPGAAADPLEMAQAARRALVDADVREAMRELELPHVVVCRDPVTGLMTLEGPYDDGLDACRAAEEETISAELLGTGLVYSVLPVLPPYDSDS